jgi:hypothetical protein
MPFSDFRRVSIEFPKVLSALGESRKKRGGQGCKPDQSRPTKKGYYKNQARKIAAQNVRTNLGRFSRREKKNQHFGRIIATRKKDNK